jgi:hypothetical protein
MSIKILGVVDHLVSNDERVVQLSGDNDGVIASFYDKTNNPSLFLDGTSARLGNVGVKTAAPNEALTVVGNTSASGIVYSFGGNSNLWNSSYSTVCANSAQWSITTPSGSAGGDLYGTYPNPSVGQMQGYPISTATPSIGQMLQWSGTAWCPANIPNGGSGGGGLVYFLNYGVSADNPVAGLSGTLYELGRYSSNTLSAATFSHVSQTNWVDLATFITDHLDPDTITIPAGIWDLNFWGSSTANSQTQMTLRYQLYTYHESTSSKTLIATSDAYSLYDPSVVAQYVLSMVVHQTTIDINDRLLVVLQAKANSPNKDITIYYNESRPTHLHSSVPSIGGSGVIKVLNGVQQNPASLIVNVDIAENAQISQSKIYGLSDTLNSFSTNLNTVSSNLNSVTTNVSTISGNLNSIISLSSTINFIISEGDIITSGSKGFVIIPNNFAVKQWYITSDISTTATVNVKRCTYTDYPTTSSITSSDTPSLSGSTKNRNTNVTLWTAISANDYLEFYVTSNTAAKNISISLIGVRS